MSEFLDELARTLAKPMPRSKAVRVLGGALVTAAVPLLRAAPGSGAPRQPVQYPQPKKCADYHAGPTCPKLCCRDCPPIPSGGNPGVLKWCCNTDQQCDFEDPSEQYRCGRVRCKSVCPPARKCGSKCCEVGSVCADPDLEYCCAARETVCRGGNTVSCCKPDEHCCRGTCCKRGTRCSPGNARGTCKPCPKGSRKCGKTCCTKGEACCGGKCCSTTEKCCPSDICCKKSATCCGEKCCNDDQRCCGDHCCKKQQSCCGEGCCSDGTTCYRSGGRFRCCPDERLAQTPAGTVCCPPRYYAEGSTCCPTGRACTECDPPCPRGQYCQDGFCLQAA